LLCYHKHRANNEPLERVGEQDITAHVDFTSLVRHGERVGLCRVGFTDQSGFIIGIGQLEVERIVNTNPGKPDKTRQQLQTLLHPGDLGRTFKVLVQQKGTTGAKLSGLKFPRAL
jgi:SAM-dependent MidA family methyltransferase